MRFQANNSAQGKLVVIILVLGIVITSMLFIFRPKAEKKIADIKPPAVGIVTAIYQAIHIPVYSQGNVEAKTRINLAAEVVGRIVEVSQLLRDGEQFSAGDILLRIDDSDYKLAMTRADAQVAAAQQVLARTEAEAEQARFDLQRMGRSESETTAFALKLPHLKEARARLKAAQADLAIAELQFKRTTVRAPFDGRVISKKVGLGQYVSPGQVIAEIYATEKMEVRLPLTQSQLALIDLPNAPNQTHQQNVLLTAALAGKKLGWNGRIVRSESIIDTRNQLLYAVVEIDTSEVNKNDSTLNASLLTPGLFVRAVIKGKLLNDIVVLPRAALRYGDEVWLLDENNTLRKQKVHVLHKDDSSVYIDAGIAENKKVITSALDFAVDGMALSLINESGPASVEAMQ